MLRLMVAGCVTFLVTVLALFPARVAVHWFAPDIVSVSRIDGTVWRGKATAVSAPGVYLEDLEWTLHATSLLTFKPRISVTARPFRGFVESDISLSGSNDVELRNLSASIPLAMLEDVVRNRGLAGNAELNFSELTFKDGLPFSADGTVSIAGLQVPQAYNAPLGGYKLEVSGSDGNIVASVEDTDGIVDVAGTVTLSADRSFRLLAQVAPKPSTPDGLRQRLRMLPPGNAAGQYEIRLEGSL